MLQSMRNLAQFWLFKGLMLILVISFGIWGIGDMFRGNPLQRTVAKVGKQNITVQELNREFEQSLARARQSFGPELTAQQAKELGVLGIAVNALVERAGVDQDIHRLGISVNNEAVMDALATQPQFRDKEGKFNKPMLRQMLMQRGMDERAFFETERQDLSRHQLIDVFMTDGKIPESIVDTVYSARGQKRVFEIISLKNSSVTNIPEPDDKTLRNFYQNNPKLFTAPEYRALTVARMTTEDVAKDITVSDDQVRKEYDAKSAEMQHPERRDLLQVVVQDEAKAKLLSTHAQASGRLGVAAKDLGYDVIPLDGTDETSLLPELVKPVFSLKEGQISDPIKTNLGWHVVEVKKIDPAGKIAFEDVKNNLRETMQREQAIDLTSKMVNQLDDDLAAGHALEDVADSMKLRLVKVASIDAGGKMPDGKDPAELPYKEDILKAAFGQSSGETSPVMDDKKGNYIVVRTDDITPSGVKPFEKVRDDVLTAWRLHEQATRAVVAADVIVKGLREGKAATSFASQTGVDLRVSRPVSLLDSKDAGLPESMMQQIMQMKKGEVTSLPLSDQQIILRVAEVGPANTDDKTKDIKGKIAEELHSTMPKELVEQYLKYLRVLFPVDIKQDVVETVVQQGGS